MKKKIAFFTYSLEAGGIENYLLRFLIYYQDQISATVYCKSGKTGVLDKDFRAIDVKVIPFKIGYLSCLKPIKKELQKHSYAVVVDFTNNFAAIPLLAAKKINIQKRIVWYRSGTVSFRRTPFRLLYNYLINKITRKTATHILSNSITALNNFYKDYNWQCDTRFEVIYNGIDSRKFLQSTNNLRKEFGIPEHAFVIGHVGRYHPVKNHSTALEVAERMCKTHEDIYFLFVGREVKSTLISSVKESGLENRILLDNNRSDIPEVLNTLDCFYFPSTLEGNPNALIEAMITGLPFVASNIEPIKEAVPKKMLPFLVSPLDVELHIQRILEIKKNREFREKMMCKDWALTKFDAETQFTKFFDKL